MAFAVADPRFRCSYKMATLVLCAGNALMALYMLHATLTPNCFDSSPSSSPIVYRVVHTGLADAPSKEEAERIEDSNRLRRELLPSTLIERIDEIRQENEEEINKTEALKSEKLEAASELTEKLLALHKDDDDLAVTNLIISDDGLHLSTGEIDSEDYTIPGRELPPECHAEVHTDYRGTAVRWGLTHHVRDAADCCQACLDQARHASGDELKCNIWVYCPRKGGCYSPDKYTHENHECWLKQADIPTLNFKGRYGEEYRRHHPMAPAIVPWASGVVS